MGRGSGGPRWNKRFAGERPGESNSEREIGVLPQGVCHASRGITGKHEREIHVNEFGYVEGNKYIRLR